MSRRCVSRRSARQFEIVDNLTARFPISKIVSLLAASLHLCALRRSGLVSTPMATAVGSRGRKRKSGSTNESAKEKRRGSGGEAVACLSEDDCVISPIVVLKKRYDMKRYEETEECFILDFDPDDAAADLGSVKAAAGWKVDEDVAVISEKGQVACRDYPHSRHLCLKFPFDKTLHESHCKLCYCYVCDTAAPCMYWKFPVPGHCQASENGDWKTRRELTKKITKKNLN